MSRLGSTPHHNYYVLTRSYGDRKDKYRDIMLDNIDVGRAIRDRLASLVSLPSRGET